MLTDRRYIQKYHVSVLIELPVKPQVKLFVFALRSVDVVEHMHSAQCMARNVMRLQQNEEKRLH